MSEPYPVLLNLENKLAVVIGGGRVALRKVNDLLTSGAIVRVVSPAVSLELFDLRKSYPGFEIVEREYREEDLSGAYLVFAATDQRDVNLRVREKAASLNIPVNVADDRENSSFTVPSFTRKGELILALSTGGSSPAYAAKLRRELEAVIPDNVDSILQALKETREILISDEDFKLDSPERGKFLKTLAGDEEGLMKLSDSCQNGSLKETLKELLHSI